VPIFRVMNRYVGNLPPMPGVFPDYPAPVVRNAGAERELIMMRWGMPPPRAGGGLPVTDIRNTTSPHWRGWLKPENRCLVPFKELRRIRAEAEPGDQRDGRGLVCAKRRQTSDRLRWRLDRVQRRPRHEVKTDPRPSPRLRLPDDGTERDWRLVIGPLLYHMFPHRHAH